MQKLSRYVPILIITTLMSLGCSSQKSDGKISGSETTGERIQVTPESVKDGMAKNNGFTR